MKAVTIALASLVLMLAAICAQGAPQSLRDPFARAEAPRTAAPAAAGTPAVPEAPAWQPELRGVIYDRSHSLANVSGTVLAVGESVRGYRLVKVNERSVVMDRNGVSIKLTLDNREISQ